MSDQVRKIEQAYWNGWTHGYQDALKKRKEENDRPHIKLAAETTLQLLFWVALISTIPLTAGLLIGLAIAAT